MCEVCEVPEQDRWLTVAEAAEQLGVSQDTVRRHCDSGTLRCVRPLGGARKVSAVSVAENALPNPDTAA